MDVVGQDLPFVFIYLDDILVFSRTPREHDRHLRQVFQRLQQYGLVINVDKCQFSRSTIDFLGHRISAEGSFLCLKKWRLLDSFHSQRPSKSCSSLLA